VTALLDAFRHQSTACGNLGSPFMARLFTLLSEAWPTDTALAQACAAYTGDVGPAGHSLPLRIAGGLHALRLKDTRGLPVLYPPHQPDDAAFRTGILDALHSHDAFLTDWIKSPPQTNELRRSAALIPGAYLAATRFGLPIWLSELGASGGLNLMWDQFALQGPDWRLGAEDAVVTLTPDWDGPAPIGTAPRVAGRRGVDLSPLDPTRPDDLLRLSSYLWPDQPERLAMTRAAAGAVAAPVEAGDAIAWLQTRLADAPEGHLHLVQNTIAWQYFPQDAQARGVALFEAAGAVATETRPLAWLQLETDGDLNGLGGAALTLQIWPSGETVSLGRADFHGRWVRWSPPAL